MKSEKVKSKNPERCCIRDFLEAPPRLELGVKALQARALPLGYGAVKKEIALTLERETGFGPATSTLARWHSTTESLPHIGAPSGTRTRDPLIKSQLLYQLS